MGDDHTLLAELVRLAAAEKSAGDNPPWSETERAGQLRLKLVCPLAVDGIIRDGLRLELHGPHDVPHDQSTTGLTAMLLATIRGRNWHLGRLDFGTRAIHINSHRDRDLVPRITGDHFHGAERNAKLGLLALSPVGDLPIAVPLESPPLDFRGVLDEVAKRFNIPGLWLELPPWSILLI